MYRNYDCMRDILLEIAERQTYTYHDFDSLTLKKISSTQLWSIFQEKYSYEYDVFTYSFKQMVDAGLIDVSRFDHGRGKTVYEVKDITPLGHELLDSIKQPSLWDLIKRGLTADGGTLTIGKIIAAAETVNKLIAQDPSLFTKLL